MLPAGKSRGGRFTWWRAQKLLGGGIQLGSITYLYSPAHIDQSFRLVAAYEPCAQSTCGVGVLDSGTGKGGVNSIGQCFHT